MLLVVTTMTVVRLGGLDREVITEAPKSLLYRWQYWRATCDMIGDHPWFGCGLGNFKSYYTRYKAPEASETIADPHNFLLEIAATAGLPSLVLFLLGRCRFHDGLVAASRRVSCEQCADAGRGTRVDFARAPYMRVWWWDSCWRFRPVGRVESHPIPCSWGPLCRPPE